MRIALKVLYVLICIVLTVIVLCQEGKDAGLGALAGASSDTYWGKNKGRSKEGKLVVITRVLAVLFFVLSIVLSMNFLQA